MSRINKLPEQVIRRIAAGEVIERPASALKELVENALDAGARRITVEWEQAGRKKLRVTDDGHGMTPEEARLALERHATSKIGSFEDLEQVMTFGFRGEALPSIAAVSRFRLVTRPQDAPEAWSIECEGGNIVREGPAGAPCGTSIFVEDLFFNTPARGKFLKSDGTERGFILRTIEDIALAAPRSSFQVVSDQREVFQVPASHNGTPPETTLFERLKTCWGAGRVNGLKPVRQSGRFLTVWGWISDIHAPQSTARYQRLFVNGRPIVSRRLSHALYEAYRGSLFVGKHPLAVLFLDMNPTLVDVNVHPAKREVRISHEEEAYGFLLQSLRNALAGHAEMPSAFAPSHDTPPPDVPSGGSSVPGSFAARGGARVRVPLSDTIAAISLQAPASLPETFPTPSPPSSNAEPAGVDLLRRARPEALAQLDGTYILARLEGALFIFDQHAAAERVLYEKLSEAAQNKTPHRQTLLLPWVWELSAQAAALVNDHLPDFSRLGYELEPFGSGSFRVKGVPGVLGDSPKVRSLLEGLADDLLAEAIPRGWDSILVRAACRGSIKAHDALKQPEMEKILKDLQRCRVPWCCPHGRPTYLRLASEELEKRFKRV